MAEQTDQRAALDAALAELATAITDANDRVVKKLDALAAANPDLSAEIQGIKDDVAAVGSIAADAAPAPVDTPADVA